MCYSLQYMGDDGPLFVGVLILFFLFGLLREWGALLFWLVIWAVMQDGPPPYYTTPRVLYLVALGGLFIVIV